MQVDLDEVIRLIDTRIAQAKLDYKLKMITAKELQVTYRHLNHVKESLIFDSRNK